jgi:4-amino-4-deoxy-L-arabinose transferase-like glycosyltransferase
VARALRIAAGTIVALARGPSWLVSGALPLSIVFLALGLRLVRLTSVPNGFFVDEASSALDAHAIAHSLRDQHGMFLPVFFQALGEWVGGFHVYWEAPFLALFGLSEFAVRLASAEAGALTVLLVYLFVTRMYSQPIGLVSASLLAIVPWHLIQSRVGWHVFDVPLVTALCLTLFYKGLGSSRWLPLSFICWAIGFYTYFPGRLFFPLLGLAALVTYARPLWQRRQAAAVGTIAALVMLIPVVPAIRQGIFFVRLNQLSNSRVSLLDQLNSTWASYVAHFGPGFLFQTSTDWITRHYVRGFGMLYLFEAPFLVIGLVVVILRHRRADLFLLSWLAVYPVAAAWVGPPVSTRSITGVIALQIVAAQGVVTAIQALGWVVRRLRRRPIDALVAQAALSLLLLATAAGSTAAFMHTYLVDYPRYSSGWDGWQWGAEPIVAYFQRHTADYDQELMNAEFNAPEELLIFYRLADHQPCTRCRVTNLSDTIAVRHSYAALLRQLWAVSPGTLQQSDLRHVPYRVVATLTYPSGQTAFLFIATGPGLRPPGGAAN